MRGSGNPATCAPITPRQARVIVAVLCAASVIGVVSARANGNGNGNGASVTHTKEHFQDQPIDDVNRCNGHRVVGQGTMVVEEKQKTSPGRFETWFKVFQHGKVHWDLDPNERYQYHFTNEDYTRSSTPHWTTTTETRKNIIRIGPHRHGNLDCHDDHYGKGRRPKGDSWFFYERVTFSSTGASSNRDKFRDECK